MTAMGELMVVSGPPGAGKSTVAERLATLFDPSALVTGDDFFAFLREGAVPPWLAGAREQNAAVIEAAAAASGRLAAHCDVVYDGVVGPWFLESFLMSAGVSHVQYVVLLPPLAVCLARVRSREGHGFTDRDAAEHMWHEFARCGIDRRHVVSDHDQDAAALARMLAQRVQDGSIRHPQRRTGARDSSDD
jgi:cytidylate kinase